MDRDMFFNRCCDVCNTAQGRTPAVVTAYVVELQRQLREYLDTRRFDPGRMTEAAAGAFIALTAAVIYYGIRFASLTEYEDRRLAEAGRPTAGSHSERIGALMREKSGEQQLAELRRFGPRFLLLALAFREVSRTGEVDEETMVGRLGDMLFLLEEIEAFFGIDKAELWRCMETLLTQQPA